VKTQIMVLKMCSFTGCQVAPQQQLLPIHKLLYHSIEPCTNWQRHLCCYCGSHDILPLTCVNHKVISKEQFTPLIVESFTQNFWLDVYNYIMTAFLKNSWLIIDSMMMLTSWWDLPWRNIFKIGVLPLNALFFLLFSMVLLSLYYTEYVTYMLILLSVSFL
jgi:hypothetical protein